MMAAAEAASAPVLLSCLLGHLGGLLVAAGQGSGAAGQARVEVLLLPPPAEELTEADKSYTLQGALLGRPGLEQEKPQQKAGEEEEEEEEAAQEEIRGSLVLVSGPRRCLPRG